jgi:hypothetical protein
MHYVQRNLLGRGFKETIYAFQKFTSMVEKTDVQITKSQYDQL